MRGACQRGGGPSAGGYLGKDPVVRGSYRLAAYGQLPAGCQSTWVLELVFSPNGHAPPRSCEQQWGSRTVGALAGIGHAAGGARDVAGGGHKGDVGLDRLGVRDFSLRPLLSSRCFCVGESLR